MSGSFTVGYCCVCCSHCGTQKRIPEKATDLRRFIEAYRYGDWIEHVTRDFNYPNLIKGLQWFANSACRDCAAGGEMPSCEVRECCSKRGYENCYSCGDFSSCRKIGYQKETYEIDRDYQQTRRIGHEKWRKEQERRREQASTILRFLKGNVLGENV